MKIKEITENWGNRHMHGLGERPQDHHLLEKPKSKRRERRLKDNIGFTLGHNDAGGAWAGSGAKTHQM
jgi:hypothetical protein